jgi:anti-anti-sigma factor
MSGATPDGAHEAPRSIIVELNARGYAAVVALEGEHDLATREALRVAFAPLVGNLLVDLERCTFLDSTVIATILRKADELAREGCSLEIALPARDSPVANTLELVGIAELVSTFYAGERAASL